MSQGHVALYEPSVKIWKKGLKIIFWGRNITIMLFGHERERERKKKRKNTNSLFDLQRSFNRNSSGQERKFICSTRATRGYRKHEISPRIPAKSLRNQRFRV